MTDNGSERRYLLLVLAVAITAIGGYLGYQLYPRFGLPATEGVGLVALAAAAGTASFFSPCSFPLLLALLGRPATAGENHTPTPRRFAASLGAGAAAFMIAFGALIGLGGEALFAQVTFDSIVGIAIRLTVGVLLIALGLMQLEIVSGSMHAVGRRVKPLLRKQAELRREKPTLGYAVFGFGYVLAGFG